MARLRWRQMGARTTMEARAYFVASTRRELGLTFVIAMARHRLQREPFVGMSRAATRAMRDARGMADRRPRPRRLEPSLADRWVFVCSISIYRHQAPGEGWVACWRHARE